ncbi:hypothetical protein KUC14_36250 [Alteromonas sp. KC14]|nr:hypothetical protein KUC14_36250 [Alteromonas sp. KC14]
MFFSSLKLQRVLNTIWQNHTAKPQGQITRINHKSRVKNNKGLDLSAVVALCYQITIATTVSDKFLLAETS